MGDNPQFQPDGAGASCPPKPEADSIAKAPPTIPISTIVEITQQQPKMESNIQQTPVEPTQAGKQEDHIIKTFSEKGTRRAFIQKVYLIVCVQLLLITSIITIFSFVGAVKVAALQNSPYLILAYIIAVVLLVILSFWEGWIVRKSPENGILLGFFTLTYGFMIAVKSFRYEPHTVVLGAYVTTIVIVGVTAFALLPNVIDFTARRGIIMALMMVVIIFSVVFWGIRPFDEFALSRILGLGPCIVAFLFAVLLIWDTHLMVKREENSPGDYVYAALHISCISFLFSFPFFYYFA